MNGEPFTRQHLERAARLEGDAAAYGVRLRHWLQEPNPRAEGIKGRWHIRINPERETCPGCGDVLGRDEPRCVSEARSAAYERTLRDGWNDAVPWHMKAANFPPRFNGKDFGNFSERRGATKAKQACERYAESFEVGKTTRGLFLVGGFGAGKSHLMKATGERIIQRTLANVLFLTALEIEETVKEGFDKGGSTVVQDAQRAELLELDDLGQDAAPTAFTRKLIFSIVDHRYRANLPTIVSSNVGDAVLAEQYGSALVDRLYECTTFVPVQATSYRKEMAAQASG